MKENKSLKTLIAYSTPLPESDQEDEDIDDLIENAEMRSDFLDITDSIGTENFKNIYLLLINDIKKQEIENQIQLCNSIITKAEEVYNFEFLKTIDIYTQEDINNVYDFISFIEFNYMDFLFDLLIGLITDLRHVDIPSFVTSAWNEIQRRINEFGKKTTELIFLFLITNNKENIINFIVNMIEKNRIMLTLELMTKELGIMEETMIIQEPKTIFINEKENL